MVNRQHAAELAQIIADARGGDGVPIVELHACSGGSIHQSRVAILGDGSKFFIKAGRNAGDMFVQEASGLASLQTVGVMQTPAVVALGKLPDNWSCLILEWIEQPPKSTNFDNSEFWLRFGRDLAHLHLKGIGHGFGWASDNYIGSSPQKNETRETWVEFFRECRLDFQVKLLRRAGLGSVELFRGIQRLSERLDDLIGIPESRPTLLHGDLWSGNYLVSPAGAPILIDPAVYYGSAEAELAMPLLFGGFPKAFFDAYDEVSPLEDGWQDRVQIYQLYHLLNHLNLFGTGYLDSCLEIVRRFGS